MTLERCVTAMTYETRLVPQDIYEWKDAEETRNLFRNWYVWLHAMRGQTVEPLEPMARAARMIGGHLEKILPHWTRRLPTVFMEGLNTLFWSVRRNARG
jgi:hypothetical protein